MKCPYCGHENEGNSCMKCFAEFPIKAKKEPKEEEIVLKRKHKELKENGT
jgi:ribosomal protein L40E